jgi:polyhydroxyalkanoate synthase
LPLFLSILWTETAQDADLRRRAFAGLRRYQLAPRSAEPDPPRVVARAGRAALLTRNGGLQGSAERAPVILIPSLINPPGILDLTERRSLLRFLLRNNHDAYVMDWGTPEPGEEESDLADHVARLLLPLVAHFQRPPILVGYCLGGTLAIGAAARLAALAQPVQGLATIAAPWDFAQYDPAFRAQIAAIWQQAEPACTALGLVPMEVFQTGFWALDPARTIAKYARFGELEVDTPAWRGFIAVEDWANEGAPLTLASGRDLARRCYESNMTACGQWSILGTRVNPAALACPTLAIASTSDRIVPAAAAPPAGDRLDLALGHVGMMIGSRAEERLWRGLSEWLTRTGG